MIGDDCSERGLRHVIIQNQEIESALIPSSGSFNREVERLPSKTPVSLLSQTGTLIAGGGGRSLPKLVQVRTQQRTTTEWSLHT